MATNDETTMALVPSVLQAKPELVVYELARRLAKLECGGMALKALARSEWDGTDSIAAAEIITGLQWAVDRLCENISEAQEIVNLIGDNGSDLLAGAGAGAGAGGDALPNGTGKHVFSFESGFGHDLIRNFEQDDQLRISADINGSGIYKASDLAQFVSGNGNRTMITIGDDSICLEGISADDFLHHLTQFVKIV